MKKILYFLPFLLLSACYPIYKTTKPEVEVTILDEKGEAIPDVKVVLLTEVHPAKIDGEFDEKATNQLGKVLFNKQADWQVEFFMIHGAQYYNWHLCVSKKGYLTQEFIKIDSGGKIKIVLKKGKNPSREFPYYC